MLANGATLFAGIMHVNYKVYIEQKQWCARVSKKEAERKSINGRVYHKIDQHRHVRFSKLLLFIFALEKKTKIIIIIYTL